MATTKWVLDSTHSDVEFKVKHLMISTVTGRFSSFLADVSTEEEDFTKSKVTFTVDAASISTNNEQRDGHIKGSDFFDVANHPQIKFVITKIENVDNDGSYNLYGDLTIRSITKNVKLEVEFGGVIKDPWGNTRAGFAVNGKINRKDFGLTWHMTTDAGGIVLGDDVRIHVALELIKA
jgi:polyisoprenoid-binding protein YceI